jgi:hypothetical protein
VPADLLAASAERERAPLKDLVLTEKFMALRCCERFGQPPTWWASVPKKGRATLMEYERLRAEQEAAAGAWRL